MKQRNAPRAAVPDWSGQRHHRAERGADAGRPADAEHDAEQRRSGQAGPGRERRLEDPPGEHEPVERAEEQQAEQDRHPAEHLGDPVRVRLQQLPDPARRQPDQREHGREAEDEQRRPRDRPAAGRIGRRGGRGPGAGGDPAARPGRPLRAQRSASAAATAAPPSALASAPDIPVMYARYPGTSGRQHGRQEGDRARRRGDRDGQQQRSGVDQAGHAHACPGSVGTSVSVGMVPSMAESG